MLDYIFDLDIQIFQNQKAIAVRDESFEHEVEHEDNLISSNFFLKNISQTADSYYMTHSNRSHGVYFPYIITHLL